MSEKIGYAVCKVGELADGERVIMDINGRSVGVFNVGGEFYALRNMCPHEGAELCRGTITGMNLPGKVGEYEWVRDGEIIRCPWHGWEFDIKTGESIFNPHKVRVRSYETCAIHASEGGEEGVDSYAVEVNDEDVVVVYL